MSELTKTRKERELLKILKSSKEPPAPLPWGEQLVAYLDILGFTEKIESSGPDASGIMDDMLKFRRCVVAECITLAQSTDMNSLQIGDGFIIVTNLESINELCDTLSRIQWRVLLECKTLLRGSLTAGEVKVDTNNNIFIGKAILDAISLERKNAIYPRIIFDYKTIETHVKTVVIDDNRLADDHDKIKYIDYIKNNLDSFLELTQEEKKALLSEISSIDKTLKERYNDFIESDNKRAAQNYGWLISKLDTYDVLSKFGTLGKR